MVNDTDPAETCNDVCYYGLCCLNWIKGWTYRYSFWATATNEKFMNVEPSCFCIELLMQ